LKASEKIKDREEESKTAGEGEFSSVGLDRHLYGLKLLGICSWMSFTFISFHVFNFGLVAEMK